MTIPKGIPDLVQAFATQRHIKINVGDAFGLHLDGHRFGAFESCPCLLQSRNVPDVTCRQTSRARFHIVQVVTLHRRINGVTRL